jgi:KDO2-lipid IV(A) lauroyltransferase
MGRHLGEFSQMPKLKTPEDARRRLGFVNREIAEEAIGAGRGVLFVTAHVGAWELSPFCLSLSGTPPVNFLARRIDNPRVEAVAERYRTLHGNRQIDKRDAARPVLTALRRGEMVGLLADLNTLPHEGVFVDFFGLPASTTTGVAIFALRTDAVVLPAFTYWDAAQARYVLEFQRPLEVVRTGSKDDDVRANTQSFTTAIEDFIRRHPDQWIWIHKRWKTRPPDSPPLY